ncbi:MAG TPA: bifunctional phosphopantothenoylcysteine decarboxylase/phosphopantothenate--cysteine ligase CoaBC [Gemmatimonadaceae bacterium]|nr:bifunctional phosphopantothenoylcysteine decarboxylase/phosphopantothenate--cysteine ligase CoaBC [Gemmatimonadaceae bacterium]
MNIASCHADVRSSTVRPFDQRRILLGVTGGIASYKSAWLARLLTQHGAEVDVVLSRSAQEFIGAVTFEALTGRRVYSELVAAGHALDHIKLAQAAHAVVVAPATADFLARAASGQSADLLGAILLATKAPVLLVPAMNDRMWVHPQTVRNVEHLRQLGYGVLEPDIGPLASAEEGTGPGRMPEPETIVAHLARRLEALGPLFGKRVVVSAGPTREPVDAVRYVSNRSSGKMGVALAASAWRRGAEVTLIHGPLGVPRPVGVRSVATETTEQMAEAVSREVRDADVLVMAAAPSDFRPANAKKGKIKKGSAQLNIELTPAPDILLDTLPHRGPNLVAVGFALETENAEEYGRAKLAAKGLDLVVVNDATEPGAGFEVDTNRVTLIRRNGEARALPLLSKLEVADAILDEVEELLSER